MNNALRPTIIFLPLFLCISSSIAQSEPLILNEDLLQNSKLLLVEVLPQKRNFFNTKIVKFKFGNYSLTEGKHSLGNTSTQKQTKNGNQVINRSKFKLTISNNNNITSSAKVMRESKELIFDNETFLERLIPAIGSTIPSVEKLSAELSGTLTINSLPNAEWKFYIKKIINRGDVNTFEMSLTKGQRFITIQIVNRIDEERLIQSGFEFFESDQSLAALYVGLPNKTIRLRNNLDAETEIILATMMTCLMVEYPSPSIFTNSY